MIDHMIWLGIVWKGAGGSLMLNVPPLKHGGSSPIKQVTGQTKETEERKKNSKSNPKLPKCKENLGISVYIK